MTPKKIRIIAYIALGLMLVFSVMLVLSFMNIGGLTVIILTGATGGIGIILFILMKILQKISAKNAPSEGGQAEEGGEPFAEPKVKPPKEAWVDDRKEPPKY